MYRILFFLSLTFLLSVHCFGHNDSAAFLKILKTYPKTASIEEKMNFVKTQFDSLKQLGNNQQTFYFLTTANSYFKQRGEFLLEINTLNYFGLLYNKIGKYGDAIQTFSQAEKLMQNIKVAESGNDGHTVMYLVYLNYGNTFYFLDKPDKSLLYYKKALYEIKSKTNQNKADSLKMAQVYNNFGITYSVKMDYATGMYYFNKALSLNSNLKDSVSIANVLSNLASLHSNNNEYESALSKYFIGKKIYEKGNIKENISFINGQIASVYLNSKRSTMALPFALVALKNSDTTAFSSELIDTYRILYNVYENLGDFKNEVKYLKLFTAASDSLHKDETINEINKKEMLMQFNTMHITDSIKGAEELKRRDINLLSKKRQSYFLIAILLLAVVAIGFIYSRFRVSQKQKSIIETQKKVVDEKNKEITDSINYAKRIQTTLLPTEKYIEKSIARLRGKKS
ncbi:hypothetical protein BH10BAC1_BH10BAC1_06040 [soil metagenome]